MPTFRLVLLLALVPFISVSPAAAQTTILHVGTLLESADDAPSSDRSVIVRAGKIVAIQDGFITQQVGSNDEVHIVDLRDRFVMPGLIDTHVHLTLDATRHDLATTTNADLTVVAVVSAKKTLQAGITTVSDLGSANAEALLAVRDAINRGLIDGPRILAAGESISATAGHGDRRLLRKDITETLQNDGVCDGPSACQRAVRLQYRKGADLIKVHATGGGADPNGKRHSQPEMSDEELKAIVDTAHALGMRVAAHAHGTLGIKAAIRAGVDSVEHGSWLDKEAIAAMRNNNTALVRTAYLQDYFLSRSNIPAAAQELRRKNNALMDPGFREAVDKGVFIVMGTDAGIMPHGLNARELIKYVSLGMSPQQALQAGTTNAAKLLGLQDEIGQIRPGMAADIIAVGASPLQDISQVENVSFVMKGGRIFRQD